MAEPCQHKAICSCRNALESKDYVKNKIESCIQKYMDVDETADYLQKNEQISPNLTKSIWEQLQRESPDFFKNYILRCRVARQLKMFNDMLAKHVSVMFEHGDLDICGASPAIRAFLQHPEGSRLLEKLATTTTPSYTTKASFASSALPDANGSSVTQLQIPYDPQNQLHQWSTSNDLASDNYLGATTFAPATTDPIVTQSQIPNDQENILHDYYTLPTTNNLAYNNLGDPTNALATTGRSCTSYDPDYIYIDAPTIAPATTDQWCQSTDPAYDYLGAPTYVPAAIDQWSSSNDPFYTGGQTVAQEYLSTFDFGGDIGEHAPSFLDRDMELPEQLVMQSNEQLYDLDGQYQQQSQVQQNFSVEAQQTVQYGGGSNGFQYGGGSNMMQNGEGSSNMMQYGGLSNGMQYGGGSSNGFQYGESVDQQLCYTNVDTYQPMQMYTSVDQQQARGVKRHHPESEAFNNPGIGDGTLTTAQNQNDLQWQGQRQGP
ncbi:uncharacterized protein LOC18027739 [Eutrema salsugineum]|uniref:uncharacterized protein LOC18027739 n=1 Tax=Eutrema salsugineum TaxID=72664 RepID=UPI000CED6118|nr:uncharacterized protein LOC18027739 [Eutrema salsugineum]